MDPVLKDINIDKKLWQSVTEYPPNLQWAVCNFRRDSRGVFSSRSIGATLSQQTQSVSGIPHLHPSYVFHSRPEMNAFIFTLPPLFFKDTAGAPPIKVPLFFCLLSSTSVLSFFFLHLVTKKRCLLRFPFLSISIQGWLEHLCRRPTLFLSFLASASTSHRPLGCLVRDPGTRRQPLIHIRVIVPAMTPDLPMPWCSLEHCTLGNG